MQFRIVLLLLLVLLAACKREAEPAATAAPAAKPAPTQAPRPARVEAVAQRPVLRRRKWSWTARCLHRAGPCCNGI